MAILELPPVKWELTKVKKIESNGDGLGDGYTLTGSVPFSGRDTFNITIPGLTTVKFNEIWAIIKDFAGYKTFGWREFSWQDYKTYVFDGEPQVIPQGLDCWELRLILKETSPSADPFAANVALFLKCNGTNGSTNIIDSSPTPKTISVFGTAQISTAQSKYGGSSLFSTDTTLGSFVQATTTINLSNYTFEVWIYQTVVSDWTLFAGSMLGDVDFSINGSQISIGRTNVSWDITTNVAFTYNTFQHIAFSRSNYTQKIFLNGLEVFSSNYEIPLTATNPRVMCTRDNYQGTFVRQLYGGYVDSVRLTDSVGRYTTTFNPETDTYLNVYESESVGVYRSYSYDLR